MRPFQFSKPPKTMKIKNIDGLTVEEINNEVAAGAKFVFFQYTISLLVITFKRSSDIYFIKSDEKASAKGLPYTIISFLLGWWGIPWGPIYTIQTIGKNLGGGKDVTQQVIPSLIGTTLEATA